MFPMTIYRPLRRQGALRYLPPCGSRREPAPPAPAAARVWRQGGSQIQAPQFHLIFDLNFPHSERFLEWHLYHCLTGLVTGSFAQGLRQYGAGPGVYAGYATPNFPTGDIRPAELEDWLRDMLLAGGLGSGAAGHLYMLFPGPDTIVGEDGFVYGIDWCAYHSSLQPSGAAGAAAPTPYTVVPYPGAAGTCGQSLGLSDLDILTVLASHELAEAMTDAIPGQGWTGDEGEIDDFAPCLWRPIEVRFDDFSYKIQAYWDEQAERCWTSDAKD
jgi:hypothetical protein